VERRKILDTIRACRMEGTVELLGFVSLPELLELAYRNHLFVAPSMTGSDGDHEGGAPMVLPLLAATGIAIISTRHRDIPDVVKHGVTGMLADECDVAGLVSCIEQVIAEPARSEEMAVAGRAHVEAHFNARLQGRRLGAIYRDVVSDRSRP
jgi:colanic acid/amylovoran biosynthesis glycosyltransferase